MNILNAIPNGETIDAAKNKNISFTFYGEKADSGKIYIYNSKGKKVETKPIAQLYNGEKGNATLSANTLINGNSYSWQAKLITSNFDMFVTRGMVQPEPFIQGTVAEFPTGYDAKYIPVHTVQGEPLDIKISYYIHINEQVKKIIAYDSNSGMVTLTSPLKEKSEAGNEYIISPWKKKKDFDSGEILIDTDLVLNGEDFKIAFGEDETLVDILNYDGKTGILTTNASGITEDVEYYIYRNYYLSPKYGFKTKVTPSLTATTEIKGAADDTVYLDAECSQSTGILKHKWEVFIVNGEDRQLVYDTVYIYNGNYSDMFSRMMLQTTYIAKLTVTTEDNYVVTAETETFSAATGTYPSVISNVKAVYIKNKSAVKITADVDLTKHTVFSYRIHRKDLATGKTSFVANFYRPLQTQITFYDYTAINGKEYQYIIMPFINEDTSSYAAQAITNSVRINGGWSLTSYDGDVFILGLNLENPTIEQSAGRQLYTTSNWKYDRLVNNGKNYQTINVKCALSNMSYVFADAFPLNLNERLREISASDIPCLLKSSNGSVWAGYVYSLTFTQEKNVTYASFSFVEVMDYSDFQMKTN